jgi:multisubunit Na+/H+ antiporter MnhB subunit
LAAVALFIVYGLMTAVAWVRLDAIDVALAEVAIGAGLTGILLVSAAARIQRPVTEGTAAESGAETAAQRGTGAGQPAPTTLRVGLALLCAALAAALATTLVLLPDAAPDLTPAAADHLERSGLGNPVTAVLLDFRSYDTLLETMVLLVALVGVWSLGADRSWGGIPGLRQHARPHGVLAYFGRLLPVIGLLVAVHLLWAGADAPGGAFQAGTVLAAVWLLAAMAGLAEAPAVSTLSLRLTLVIGPAFFLLIGTLGAFFGDFLGLPQTFARPLILTIELLLTLSIAVTLGLLVLGVPRRLS